MRGQKEQGWQKVSEQMRMARRMPYFCGGMQVQERQKVPGLELEQKAQPSSASSPRGRKAQEPEVPA